MIYFLAYLLVGAGMSAYLLEMSEDHLGDTNPAHVYGVMMLAWPVFILIGLAGRKE